MQKSEAQRAACALLVCALWVGSAVRGGAKRCAAGSCAAPNCKTSRPGRADRAWTLRVNSSAGPSHPDVDWAIPWALAPRPGGYPQPHHIFSFADHPASSLGGILVSGIRDAHTLSLLELARRISTGGAAAAAVTLHFHSCPPARLF